MNPPIRSTDDQLEIMTTETVKAPAANATDSVAPESLSMLNDLWSDFIKFDWENVIVAGIEHLAWPVVTLLIALAFKPELIALMGRLKNLKGKGFSADFAELEKSSEKIHEEIREYKSYYGEDLLTIARIKPTAAVVEAWKEVEASMINLLPTEKFDTQQGRRQISGFDIVKQLEATHKISGQEVLVLHELREIRNRAAHSVDREVTPEQAEQYVDMALTFANKFNQMKSPNSFTP